MINNGSNQDQVKSVENILQVFPNPANTSSNFIINSSLMQEADGNIIILDVAGKIVKELRYSADQKIFIETPEKPGIFIVMIKSDNGKSEKTRLAVE
ncbi:MAG: T9SS type A sorting domain-containing protein [Saprospiraceae bacterium]|nr:T9SS type A sorting domain-containing protein [Saprospiraceae bacterium]